MTDEQLSGERLATAYRDQYEAFMERCEREGIPVFSDQQWVRDKWPFVKRVTPIPEWVSDLQQQGTKS